MLLEMMIKWEQDTGIFPEDTTRIISELNRHLEKNTRVRPSINLREFMQQLKLLTINEMGFDLEEDCGSRTIIDKAGYIDAEVKAWFKNERKYCYGYLE